MTQTQRELIKSIWSAVTPINHVVVGGLFFDRLFEITAQMNSQVSQPDASAVSKITTLDQLTETETKNQKAA